MTTRLIANKYREGKARRTLKRELKVLEIVKGEANIAVEHASFRERSSRATVTFLKMAAPIYVNVAMQT